MLNRGATADERRQGAILRRWESSISSYDDDVNNMAMTMTMMMRSMMSTRDEVSAQAGGGEEGEGDRSKAQPKN